MSAELLAVVEVDKDDRVVCQAPGCGRGVYKRIHVVRHNGALGVYGEDCFDRLFVGLSREAEPRYGGGPGRVLSAEERQLLIENTERLITQFELERQQAIERARQQEQEQASLQEQERLRREQAERERLARSRAAFQHRAAPARVAAPGPTPDELKSVEAEAKRLVRERYGVDPDQAGWRGLVMAAQRELLGR